jgi:ribonuclease VapC
VTICVVDASVVLAVLQSETGWENFAGLLPVAAISTVNLGEVASKLSRNGLGPDVLHRIIDPLPMTVIDLTAATAIAAGAMEQMTKPFGLSLGDRICISLAIELGLPVYTADRSWAQLGARIPVEIRLIR